MYRVENGGLFQVTASYTPTQGGRASVIGTVKSGDIPVCSLALANGQQMFSCGEDLGNFALDVPLDEDGNVTLMVFTAGFQPFKEIIFDVELLNGSYDGQMKSPGIFDFIEFDIDPTTTTFDVSGTEITITQDAFREEHANSLGKL